MNQELFKKYVCNQVSHYKEYKQLIRKESYYMVQANWLSTKKMNEDTGKSMKNILHVLQYTEKHLLG